MSVEIDTPEAVAELLYPSPDVLDSDTARGDRRVHHAARAAIRADRRAISRVVLAALASPDALELLRVLAQDLAGTL